MPVRHIASLVFTLILFSSSLPAQQLPEIEYEKYVLANGLQVILHQTKKIPAVNVNLWYHVGAKNEQPGKTGFAHLFEHMMFQGSKHVQGEYLQLVEQAGANLRTGGVNGTTSNDRTNYFETVPTASLEYALWLESDRMGFLDDALTEEKFKNQQDVVKNEKRQGDNAPYSVVQYLVAENLYPAGHPYAHTVIGSIDHLTHATLDDVKEFFNTWYVPNNCTLTLSGDFDKAEAKRLVQKYFGPIPAGKPLSRPGVNIPFLTSTKRVFAKDRVPQGRLYLKYPTTQLYSREESMLDYAASVLGQGETSRLYIKLVRELELASSVSAYNSCREISGEFTIVVTARPGKSLEEIRAVVDAEIQRFARTGVTEEELEREKASTEMSFISNLERIGGFGGVADKLNGYNTFLGDPDYFQKDYDRYRSVTTDDVKREFSKWVAQANRLEIYISAEKSGRPDAEEFDRSTPPGTGSSVVFSGPETQSRTLDNGLEVIVNTRSDLPIVSARLLIRQQDILESAEKAGVSSLTANMLDEGTGNRDVLQLRDDLDDLGSSLSSSGNKFGASVNWRSLKRNLEATMEIFADVLLSPAFPEEEFDRVRKQSVEGLQRRNSNASMVASLTFNRMLHGTDHPLGRSSSGTEASLNALAVDDLKDVYGKFWRPNNASLIFVGDITLDEAVRLTEKYLGDWDRGDVETQELPVVDAPGKTTIYLVDKQGAPQSQIRIGSVAPSRFSDDYYPLRVSNTVLGGAFASRLNLNLREDKGYTYGAFCRLNMQKLYGYWVAAAGVQTKFTREALGEFRKEITGLSGGIPVTTAELGGIKKNLMRGFVQNFESTAMVLGQLAPLISLGLPVSEIDRYIPAVEEQTPASVMATAKKYYHFDSSIIVIVGDLEKIEQDVRDLNWGEVVVLNEEGSVISP